MGQPATPRYMPDKDPGFYTNLSPGLAFYTFFPIWTNQWDMDAHEKSAALAKVIHYSAESQKQTKALIDRQNLLIKTVGDKLVLSVSAKSTSPFMTGTGMEHPLENGFAFLNPYGLPYLPGSSVKGVLRNTARLLADDAFGEGTYGWTSDAIITLFGSEVPDGEEKPEDFRRGGLTFWDVIVSPKVETKPGQPASQSLKVDILTPHQSHYLQGTATPHDSGEPNPVPFLCVGPGAEFNFHVQANPGLLGGYADSWQTLIEACFLHTFDWLGFGAKTAVGYGVLSVDAKAKAEMEAKAKQRAKDEANAGKSPGQLKIDEFNEKLKTKGKWQGNKSADIGLTDLLKDALALNNSEDCKLVQDAILEIGKDWKGETLTKDKKWKERMEILQQHISKLQ